jgi:hypothetical protein
MRIYIVDAFNFSHKVFSRDCQEDNHQLIIDFIWKNSLKGSDRNQLVLVFDGGVVEGLQNRGFKLKFGNSRKADDVIKDLIRRVPEKTELIVVSDDNEIKSCAREHQKILCSISKFVSKSHLGAKTFSSSGNGKKSKCKTGFMRDDGLDKRLSPSRQESITEELSKIWLKNK